MFIYLGLFKKAIILFSREEPVDKYMSYELVC